MRGDDGRRESLRADGDDATRAAPDAAQRALPQWRRVRAAARAALTLLFWPMLQLSAHHTAAAPRQNGEAVVVVVE